jgi:hypothetical protein
MHLREFDFRIDPLHDIISAVDSGLAAVRERLNEKEADGFTALENAEPLLGLGFVAAQTYALGTWADLNVVRRNGGKQPVTKMDCYACDPFTLKGGPTRIQVINAIANYFKHHDEWTVWPTNETTATLIRIGITRRTEFPIVEVTQLFTGSDWELIVLHQIVKEWRDHVFCNLR